MAFFSDSVYSSVCSVKAFRVGCTAFYLMFAGFQACSLAEGMHFEMAAAGTKSVIIGFLFTINAVNVDDE
jgi:hypothetical protein